jgi:hypothetical protein
LSSAGQIANFGTGNFTIDCWFNVSNTSAAYLIYDARSTGAAVSITLYLETGSGYNLKVYTNNAQLISATSLSISAGIWYHTALVRNSGITTLYVNGTSIASVADSNSYVQGGNFLVGVGWNINNYFPGYISNLRVVKGTALYTSNFTPPTGPLTAVTNTVLLTNQYSNSVADVSTASNVISATGVAVPSLRSPFTRVDTSTAATLYGGSMYFNGSTDVLTFASLGLYSTNFTIEAWIYLTAYPGSQGGVIYTTYHLGQSQTAVIIFAVGSNGTLSIGNGQAGGPTTSAMSINSWHHVVVTYLSASTTVQLYIDGVSQGTATLGITQQSGTTWIGGNPGDNNQGSTWFPGYISNLRASKSIVYTGTSFTVPTTPLTTSSQGSTSTALLIPGINAGIYDSTMENNLVTVGSAQISSTSTATVKFGSGSVYFNGSSYLSAPANYNNHITTGDFTVEMWVYLTTLSASAALVGVWTGTASTSDWLFTQGGTASNLRFGISSGGTATFVEGTGGLTANSWTHIAAVRKNGIITLYSNGVSVYSGALAGGTITTTGLTVASISGGSFYSTGYIDDLRITTGIARYTATFTPPTASFADIQLSSSTIITTTFTTATNIGTVTWAYNTATTRWGGLQEPTSPTNLTPMSIEDQANTSTGYFSLPQGTTGQRPPNPQAGYMRYNTTLDSVEYYNFVTGWTTIP